MSFSMCSIFRFLYTILFEIEDFLFYEVHVRCKPFSGPARARKRPRAGLRRRGARKRHSCSSHAVSQRHRASQDVFLRLASTCHQTPSRHSSPSHALSQRHRASQDVFPRLDLPRAPPCLDAARPGVRSSFSFLTSSCPAKTI